MVARATHPLAGVQAHVDSSLEEDVVALRELEATEKNNENQEAFVPLASSGLGKCRFRNI